MFEGNVEENERNLNNDGKRVKIIMLLTLLTGTFSFLNIVLVKFNDLSLLFQTHPFITKFLCISHTIITNLRPPLR